MKTKTFSLIVILFVCSISAYAYIESNHKHVQARHYVTKYKTMPVTYCLSKDQIITHSGEHINIIAPVVLFPEVETKK